MLNKMSEKKLFVIMYFEHTHFSFVLDTDLTVTGIGGWYFKEARWSTNDPSALPENLRGYFWSLTITVL